MASKTISQAKKDAAVERILSGASTTSDEARRLNCVPQAVRKWRREYESRHPEAKRRAPDPVPQEPDPAPPQPPSAPDGGLAAARAAAGLPPPQPSPAAPAPGQPTAPPPVTPQILGVIPASSSRQEDEDLTFFYAGLIVAGEFRILLWWLTKKKPFKLSMTPELEAKCTLTSGEKEALRPAAPLIARKIREFMGSSEKSMLVGVGIALVTGAADRMAVIIKAVQEAEQRWKKEGGAA